MALLPILAIIIGVLLGAMISGGVPLAMAGYLTVAVLAGMDSFFGGIRSLMEGKYQTDVFVTGFIANILAAIFLVWLGNGIGAQLSLVAALVFGTRIFTNLSLVRRMLLTQVRDRQERRRREREEAVQAAAAPPPPNAGA